MINLLSVAACDPHGVPARIRPIVVATRRWASVMLALAAYVCPVPAQVAATPSLPDARTAREFGFGLVGGIAGLVVGSQAGRLLGDVVRGEPYQPKHDDEIGDLYGTLGLIVGQAAGSAVGVYYSGRMDNVQDSFGQTLIGATVGGFAGAAVYFVIRGHEGLSLPGAVVMLVAAPIGAVIGFNHSRHAEPPSAAAGLRRAQYRLLNLRLAF